MAEEYITRAEFDQYSQRVLEENNRQNERLTSVEESVKQITELTLAVNKLANTMDQMVAEQKNMGDRLKAIEEQPAKNWNTVKVAVLTAVGTAIGTGIVAWLISIF